MPKFASRKVLIGAAVFAVVVLSGAAAGALLFYALYVVAVLAALYFVVRWAVGAGIVDAGGGGVASSRRGAREILGERYAGGAISKLPDRRFVQR